MPFSPHWNNDYKNIGNEEYIYAFERLVIPLLKQFDPELLFISAGFDACSGDPIGQFDVKPNGFAYMTKRLTEVVQNERIIAALEGGYNCERISQCSEEVVLALTGNCKSFF